MDQDKNFKPEDLSRDEGGDKKDERGPGGTESEQNLPGQRRPVGSGEYRPEQGSVDTKR